MSKSVDFRSDPSDSPEGKGLARAAWDAWSRAVNKAAEPVFAPVIAGVARKQVVELVGFWMAWHLYGGFEGLVEGVGMHPSTVWRKVKKFRTTFGEHPDTFRFPGVEINHEAYWAAMEARTANVEDVED